ncbi:hypothetical protein RSAG8_00842, partial [Rhizoctonia solani AG-8 WAC10335]
MQSYSTISGGQLDRRSMRIYTGILIPQGARSTRTSPVCIVERRPRDPSDGDSKSICTSRGNRYGTTSPTTARVLWLLDCFPMQIWS